MCQWFQALESILYWVEQKKIWAPAFPWNIHATKEEPSLKSSSFTILVRKNQSKFESVVLLKWTQYKKLGPNALRVHILKFEILQNIWKTKQNKIKIAHTTYIRNNMCQKCGGNCGLWVLHGILKKTYPENLKKSVGAVWELPAR